MRSSGLYPVNHSNQPRNRWRPLALLPSTLTVKDRYSSFPFLTTCPTKWICLATKVSTRPKWITGIHTGLLAITDQTALVWQCTPLILAHVSCVLSDQEEIWSMLNRKRKSQGWSTDISAAWYNQISDYNRSYYCLRLIVNMLQYQQPTTSHT